MKRYRLILVTLAAVTAIALLAKYISRPMATGASTDTTLTIYSTTDLDIFQPVIDAFHALNPDMDIHYELLDAYPLYERVKAEDRNGVQGADLVLSSAMDLQVMLVNDGLAQPHVSANAAALPSWARWRDEAFGVTFEPAVMVYNTRLMKGRPLPRSRQELLKSLRSDPRFWHDRVGTYDIAQSSVGYLLASQDMRRSDEFGMLLDAFGEANAIVDKNTSPLLDHVERGDLALGYNLLGSYARMRMDQGADITIVYPQDYTLAVSRTAIILRRSANPDAAHAFLEYLLSVSGQKVLSEQSYLGAVRQEIESPFSRLSLAENQVGLLRPISLGPGLLVYQEQVKRGRMLHIWEEAFEDHDDD